MTAQQARERVQNGAALLDVRVPGWANLIDVGTLDLGESCACVLGQLEGTFWAGARRLWPLRFAWIRHRAAVAHGFQVADGFMAEEERDYQLLQDAWVEEIANRLAIRMQDPALELVFK